MPSSAFGLHRLPNPELERLLRALHRGALPSPITRSSLIEKAFGHIEGHLDLVVGRDVASAKALVVAVLAERAETRGQHVRLAYSGVVAPGTRSRDMLEQVRELLGSAKQRAALYGLRPAGEGALISTVRALSAGRDVQLRLVFDAGDAADPVAAVQGWLGARLPASERTEVYAARGVRLRARAAVVDDERAIVTSGELDGREEDGYLDIGAQFSDPTYAKMLAEEWSRLTSVGACVRVC